MTGILNEVKFGPDEIPFSVVTNGAPKAWARITTTPNFTKSYNCSTISDQGTGNHDINFINTMLSTNYLSTSSIVEIGSSQSISYDAQTGRITILTYDASNSLADKACGVIVMGDLS